MLPANNLNIDTIVADPDHVDEDSDPYPFDVDPDSDPACHFAADPDPTFNFDAEPDPSFQIKAQNLQSVQIGLYFIHLSLSSAN